MSFRQDGAMPPVYQPGWFLAKEECTRLTFTAKQEGSTTAANGTKYVPMGTLITETTGEGAEAVTEYLGFVYEDVDVTSGDMPGSLVTKGEVYEDRLPAELTAAAKTALAAKGFVFRTVPEVTRPNWTNG